MSQTKSELLADSFGNFATGSVPIGGIIMWSGSIASIPTGWNLCNGENNTPDLRNRFVLGAFSDGSSTTYPGVLPGATGGSADAVVVSHSHDVNDPGHDHDLNGGGSDDDGGPRPPGGDNSGDMGSTGVLNATTSISIVSNGVAGTNKNLPPYYALAYIMRVS